MPRVCQAPGCTKLAPSRCYARFCSAHKIRNRRHGNAAQEAVSAADLAPFVRRVEARVAKNADSAVWATLEERWGLLVQNACPGPPLTRHLTPRSGLTMRSHARTPAKRKV